MNNPHILICVEKPKHHAKDPTKLEGFGPWIDFLKALEASHLTFSEAENPTENIWLIPVNGGLLRASQLIALCGPHHTPYKAFLLPDAPVPA
jgi:hypothetical protein